MWGLGSGITRTPQLPFYGFYVDVFFGYSGSVECTLGEGGRPGWGFRVRLKVYGFRIFRGLLRGPANLASRLYMGYESKGLT